jgi:hypothetical protein
VRHSPPEDGLLYPRLDPPAKSSGPRCFQSTRATINNLPGSLLTRRCQAIKRPPTLQIAPAPELSCSEVTEHGQQFVFHLSSLTAPCILTWSPCSIPPTYSALRYFSTRRPPVACVKQGPVPADSFNQTTHISTPQWLLQRPNLSRCASAAISTHAYYATRKLTDQQCVVTGDGAVGKVRCNFSQCYFHKS